VISEELENKKFEIPETCASRLSGIQPWFIKYWIPDKRSAFSGMTESLTSLLIP